MKHWNTLKQLVSHLMSPLMGPPITYRPIDRHRITRSFLGRIDLLHTLIVLVLIVVTGISTTWVRLLTIAILGYIILVFSYRWFLLHRNFRQLADSDIGLLTRGFFIIALTGAFLYVLYSATDYLELSRSSQHFLWLLFIFANFSIMRKGRLDLLILSIFFSSLWLIPSEWWFFNNYYQNVEDSFVRLLILKISWITALSLATFGLLRLLSEQMPAFQIVQYMTQQWAQILDSGKLVEEVTEELSKRFDFDEAHVFRQTSMGLQMIAAATPKAKKLVNDLFILSLDVPSLNQKAFQDKAPIMVNDVLSDPVYKDVYYPHEVFRETRSELVVPLIVQGRAIGTLDVMSHYRNAFVPYDQELMLTVAGSLSTALENALKHELITSLQLVVKLLSGMPFSVIQLGEVLTEIAQRGHTWSGADVVLVYELGSGQGYNVRGGPFWSGKLKSGPPKIPEELGNVIVRVVEGGKPIFADNVWGENYQRIFPQNKKGGGFREREDIRSLVALPLTVPLKQGVADSDNAYEFVGVIFFNYRQPQSIEDDLGRQELFTIFSELAALAIEKSRSYDQEIRADRERRWRTLHDQFLTHIARLIAMTDEGLRRARQPDHVSDLHRLNQSLTELQETARLEAYYRHRFMDASLISRLQKLKSELSRDFPTKNFYPDISEQEEIENLEPEAVDHLSAIAIQAVTNFIRHSDGQNAWIQLYVENNAINLIVENDGRGFNPHEVAERSGLANMRLRASLIGARFHLDTDTEREGVVVSVILPIENKR